MSRYDETHDDGDLTIKTRRAIFMVLRDSESALRPKQIQYRLATQQYMDVSLREIEATLGWMVAQPFDELEQHGVQVGVSHNNIYGALPVYGIRQARSRTPAQSVMESRHVGRYAARPRTR